MNTPTLSRCGQSAVSYPAEFCHQVVAAVGKLKTRLQQNFEEGYPGHGRLIEQALKEAEQLAWEAGFPQLLLADYAEARLAEILAAGEPAYARAA